ncbi:MAG: hypothetical protein AABY42_03750, partial [Nitrospirota bacterium]
RRPVTPEVAGSSPVHPAITLPENKHLLIVYQKPQAFESLAILRLSDSMIIIIKKICSLYAPHCDS